MRITYEEPEPMKYEYQAIEESTGKILMTFQAPTEATITAIEIEGYPRHTYRIEQLLLKPVKLTHNEEGT